MEIKTREEILDMLWNIFTDDPYRQYGETKTFIDQSLLTRFEEEDEMLKYLLSVHSSQFSKLRKQNKKLKEALRFYADENSWDDRIILMSDESETNIHDYCGGKRARNILKEIEEENTPKKVQVK